MQQRVTTEEFIEKARKVHGDKYDYSKVEYVNSSTKVCIICPIHGEFWQIPNNHLRGSGCYFCSKEKCAENYRKKEEDFIKSLDYEQARIWAIDCKKYNDDEKAIENKLREMNKRNTDILMEQIKKKKIKNKNGMNDTEYAMNRKLLEKAKTSLAE